jgi:hypothetical protein
LHLAGVDDPPLLGGGGVVLLTPFDLELPWDEILDPLVLLGEGIVLSCPLFGGDFVRQKGKLQAENHIGRLMVMPVPHLGLRVLAGQGCVMVLGGGGLVYSGLC